MNMLKRCYQVTDTSYFAPDKQDEASDSDDNVLQLVPDRIKETWQEVITGYNLEQAQRQDLGRLLAEFAGMLDKKPGRTDVISHRNDTARVAPARQRP